MTDDNDRTSELPAAGGAADRYKQTYPELTEREIDRLRRFGVIKHYAEGERLFEAGMEAVGNSPEQFASYIATDMANMRAVIKAARIKQA